MKRFFKQLLLAFFAMVLFTLFDAAVLKTIYDVGVVTLCKEMVWDVLPVSYFAFIPIAGSIHLLEILVTPESRQKSFSDVTEWAHIISGMITKLIMMAALWGMYGVYYWIEWVR